MNLSDNLKRIRKENNLSQEELAEKLGVSRQSVSKWESNSAYPEMDKLIQISKMFNIGIDELLNKDIKEVREEKQVKNNINKHIDDFLNFITKAIDMFMNMTFKQKIKLIVEEIVITLIIYILLSLLGTVLNNIYYNAFKFLDFQIARSIRDFLASIYTIISLCLSVILILHIFKVRYLDYYIIVDKEINDDKKEVLEKQNEYKNVKNEKVIIRDPDHASYRFISSLLKVFLILIKINAGFMFIGTCFVLVGFVVSLVCTFTITKSGLFFIGLLSSLLACISISILLLDVLFNFILSHKTKWRMLFIIFISSLVVLGSGIGIALLGISEFDIKKDTSITYENTIPMEDNLVIHEMGANKFKYIESDNNDLRIVVKHSKGMNIQIQKDLYQGNSLEYNVLSLWATDDYSDMMGNIREQIKDLNNKKINTIDYHELYIYTSKENIEKLKSNFNVWSNRYDYEWEY